MREWKSPRFFGINGGLSSSKASSFLTIIDPLNPLLARDYFPNNTNHTYPKLAAHVIARLIPFKRDLPSYCTAASS